MTDVVTLDYQDSIAIVKLEDKASKNTFSKDLIDGLMRVFAIINRESQAKVVIVQGYDNFFCCGGTQEELLKISTGETTFADLVFYRLLLDCEVPTIAAMQGHGIGGGLVLGLYADLIVLAEECFYTANFMKYGFTPGMGATYILPKKFGTLLGTEMLYTAKNYQGLELQKRGIQATVVKKAEVVPTAFALAKELADKPLKSLKILKQHLTQRIKADLVQVIKAELIMHEQTFAFSADVKRRIETTFGR